MPRADSRSVRGRHPDPERVRPGTRGGGRAPLGWIEQGQGGLCQGCCNGALNGWGKVDSVPGHRCCDSVDCRWSPCFPDAYTRRPRIQAPHAQHQERAFVTYFCPLQCLEGVPTTPSAHGEERDSESSQDLSGSCRAEIHVQAVGSETRVPFWVAADS